MITNVCQRWGGGRASYRLAREAFDPRGFEVETLDDDATAKAFVVQHHYSKSFPAALRRFGLRERGTGELVGVVVASRPANDATLAVLGCPVAEAAEIGRIVLLERVLANAETWLLAEVFRRLTRDGFAGLVSFSDPVARSAVDGRVVAGTGQSRKLAGFGSGHFGSFGSSMPGRRYCPLGSIFGAGFGGKRSSCLRAGTGAAATDATGMGGGAS